MTTIKFVYVYKIHTMKVTYTNKHKTNEQKNCMMRIRNVKTIT